MKQIAINDYLIVEVNRDDLDELHYCKDRNQLEATALHPVDECYNWDWFSGALPQGPWQLIARCSEVSEDVAKEIVASIFGLHYFDYMNPKQGEYAPGYILDSALESFSTYLQSHSLTPQSAFLLKKI